jgi:hypothetical protein
MLRDFMIIMVMMVMMVMTMISAVGRNCCQIVGKKSVIIWL